MDKLSMYKEEIYKEAGILGLALNGLKGLKAVGQTAMESGIGKKLINNKVTQGVLNSGVGTKMAVGAGIGGVKEAIKAPGLEQDRLSNGVSGVFGGATSGLGLHALTSGLPGLLKAADLVDEGYEKYANFWSSAKNIGKTVLSEGRNVAESTLKDMDAGAKSAKKADALAREQAAKASEEAAKSQAEAAAKAKADAEAARKDPGSLVNQGKRLWNRTLGANPIKTGLVGTGIGAAAGAMGYDANKDDGSFEHSRFGAMAGGAAAGLGAGVATGVLTKPFKGVPKPLKTADFKEYIFEKQANKLKEGTGFAKDLVKYMGKGLIDEAKLAAGVTKFKPKYKVPVEALKGAGTGAAIGGATGAVTNHGEDTKKGVVKGAIIGAAGGAGIGAYKGHSLNLADKAKFLEDQKNARLGLTAAALGATVIPVAKETSGGLGKAIRSRIDLASAAHETKKLEQINAKARKLSDDADAEITRLKRLRAEKKKLEGEV